MLRDILQQGGWQMTLEVSGAMVSGSPPRGVVETSVDSPAVDALIGWLGRTGLNPQVNRGEPRYAILAMGANPPVHLMGGVLPA